MIGINNFKIINNSLMFIVLFVVTVMVGINNFKITIITNINYDCWYV
jgi:hypothetical protein